MNLGCFHPLQGESSHQRWTGCGAQCHGRGDKVGISLSLDSEVFSNFSDSVIKGQNLLVLLKAPSSITNINYALGL